MFGYAFAMLRIARLNLFGSMGAVISVCAFSGVALSSLGCASTERRLAPVDPAGSAPQDLAVEIRVSPGRGVSDRAKVEERPARFVLLSDGSLYGETDDLPDPRMRPARIRRLAREQMAEIWSLLQATGFTDAALANTRGNASTLEPRAGEVLATLEIHANGERLAFARNYKPGEADEAGMRRAIRAIASLAWATDEALAESAELPLRYDLGADPYARFATGASAARSGSSGEGSR